MLVQTLPNLVIKEMTLCDLFSSHNRKTVMDFVNAKDNGTYLWNLAHFVSVLADNVIFCCGDLLPLLSSVTSRDYGQDVIEPCGGMTLETSFSFLNRVMSLVDVIVFTSSLAFSGVETNRNLSTGGFLRQCLRLGKADGDSTCKRGFCPGNVFGRVIQC